MGVPSKGEWCEDASGCGCGKSNVTPGLACAVHPRVERGSIGGGGLDDGDEFEGDGPVKGGMGIEGPGAMGGIGGIIDG